MSRFNPSQIVNRLGRIVFATILAGVFAGIVAMFSGGLFTDATSPTAPLNMYFGAGIDIAVLAVIFGFIVPVVMCVYWTLSKWLRWTHTWLFLGAGTVAACTAWAIGGIDPRLLANPLEIVTMVSYGGAMLAAIAVSETLFTSKAIVEPRQFATGAGLFALVFVVLVPAASIGAGVIGDEPTTDEWYDQDQHVDGDRSDFETDTDPVDESDESEISLERDDPLDPETYDNGNLSPPVHRVTALEGETDAVTVVDDPRPPTVNETFRDYAVAETHTDVAVSVSDVEAEVGDGTVVPKARYHLDFVEVNSSTANMTGLDTYGEVDAEGHNAAVIQPDIWAGGVVDTDDGFYVEMERTESTHIYADIVTDDGEIHRYVVELERTDVTAPDSSN